MGSDLHDFHDDGINDAGGTTVQLLEYAFPPAPVAPAPVAHKL